MFLSFCTAQQDLTPSLDAHPVQSSLNSSARPGGGGAQRAERPAGPRTEMGGGDGDDTTAAVPGGSERDMKGLGASNAEQLGRAGRWDGMGSQTQLCTCLQPRMALAVTFPSVQKARGCLLARGSDWSAGLACVYELLSHRRGRRRALFEKVLMIT